MRYTFGDSLQWFADLQLGVHAVSLLRDVPGWSYMAADGNEQGEFYNRATGQVEYWSRQFTPEEMGGLNRNMIETRQKTLGITTGFKGAFGEAWSYETALSHAQYRARISWPRIVAARANALFLGQPAGTDRTRATPRSMPIPHASIRPCAAPSTTPSPPARSTRHARAPTPCRPR